MLVASSLLLVACDDDDDHDRPTPPVTDSQLRVTHASPDAPAVNVYVNGNLTLSDVDYKESSGIIALNAGDYEVEVRGILPGGAETTVIGPTTITLTQDQRLDVVAVNPVATITVDTVTTDISEAVTDVQVSVLHAAPAVADVDIYVTAPGDAIADATPIDANYGDDAGPLTLAANTDYRIRITPDGSSTVVYDSGETPLNFPAGTDLLLAAVENTTNIGSNPVNLIALSADGAAELYDAATGSQVRVVHASYDAGPVDVFVGGGEVLTNVDFTGSSNYGDVEAPAGEYSFVVAAAADNTIKPIDISVTIDQGISYTAYAIGSLADDTIAPLLLADDRRSIATQASIRVVHASYNVAEEIPVDVYLTDSDVITDATAAITNLAYGEYTDQIAVSEGTYTITVTAHDDKSVVVYQNSATLEAGTNYTVIARDLIEDENTDQAVEAIILDDAPDEQVQEQVVALETAA
jgi:hypothetical protein